MKTICFALLCVVLAGCESTPARTPEIPLDAQEANVTADTFIVTAIEVVTSNGSLPPQYQRTTRTKLLRTDATGFDDAINDALDRTRVNGKATLREYIAATLAQDGRRLMEIKGMVARPAPTGGGSVDIHLYFEHGKSFTIAEHDVEYDRDFDVLLELANKHGKSETTSYGDPIAEPSDLRTPDSEQ